VLPHGALKRKLSKLYWGKISPDPLTRMPFIPALPSGVFWHVYIKRNSII